VPGLGPAKREALIKHFGSLKNLKAASADELTQVQGVGPSLASKIREHFDAEAAASG
jgi:uvrABC system protein C